MPADPPKKTAKKAPAPSAPPDAPEAPVAPPLAASDGDGGGHPLGDAPTPADHRFPRREDGPWYGEGDDDRPVTIEDALWMLQAELPVVARTKTARIPGREGKQGYSYEYADLADVMAALKPLFARFGFSFTCHPQLRADGQGYELQGVLRHNMTGESINGSLPIAGRSPQDLGSAITYARRYLLGCLTGIITDDDDDGAMATHSEPTTEQLLDRLDALARGQGTDRDSITAKWREQHGGIPAAVLPLLAPQSIRPLVDSIEAWITAQARQSSPST